jgi:four helix bundle protein
LATIERFEDIESWKKARALTRAIYEVSASGEFARDFALKGQIRRAALSVMSNIAERFERGGNKEFQHFLTVAKGSAGEVRSQLYVALDTGFIDQAQFDELCASTLDASRLIAGFLAYLSQSSLKGKKFK